MRIEDVGRGVAEGLSGGGLDALGTLAMILSTLAAIVLSVCAI